MQTDLADAPRLVRDRFTYVEDVHGFLLARVDDALREWVERPRHAGGRADGLPRGRRRKSVAKPISKRAASRARLG
jgi:hypothetical protein